MEKRGQAAMEFTMTYGWALLVILVAVSALAFFGVLNPGRFLPEMCVLGPGFHCGNFVVNESGIHIEVTNGAGKDFDLFVITIGDSVNDPCGGYSGFIADSTVKAARHFLNGQTKKVKSHASYSPTERDVIACGRERPFLFDGSCCSEINYYLYLLPDQNHNSVCKDADISTGFSVCTKDFPRKIPFDILSLCEFNQNNPPFLCKKFDPAIPNSNPLKKGERFEANLIVTYKEAGSDIWHKRAGKMITRVQ